MESVVTSIPAAVPYDDRFDEVAGPDALVGEIMKRHSGEGARPWKWS